MEPSPKPNHVIRDVTSLPRVTITTITAGRRDIEHVDGRRQQHWMVLWGTSDGGVIFTFLETYQQHVVFNFDDIYQNFEQSNIEVKKVEAVLLSPDQQQVILHYKVGFVAVLRLEFESSEESSQMIPKLIYLRGWKCKDTFSKATIYGQHLYFPVKLSQNEDTPVYCLQQESLSSKDDSGEVSTDSRIIQLVNEKSLGMLMTFQVFTFNNSLHFLLAFETGSIVLYGLKNEEEPDGKHHYYAQSKLQAHEEIVTCMSFHEGEIRGVSGSVDEGISFWRLATTKDNERKLEFEVEKTKKINIVNAGILCCVIRSDGRIVATGGKDGRIRLFGLRTGKPLAILCHHTDIIRDVAYACYDNKQNKQSLLFVASNDRSITSWSLYN